jgi:hypothetical protein
MKRKKADKKKGHGKFKGCTITLADSKSPDPDPAYASCGGSEAVRFHNKTTRGRNVTFTQGWPFVESPQTIAVPAKGYSVPVHVFKVQGLGGYKYKVDPPIPVPSTSGGPDEPQVVVEP